MVTKQIFKNIAKSTLLGLAYFNLCYANPITNAEINDNRYVQQTPNWATSIESGDFFDATYLLDMRQGSLLSRKMDELRGQGYETAFGTKVSFDKWYSTKWTDFRILWMTQVTKNNGIIWGFSTGERGEKYVINPGLTLGFIHQEPISKNATLTFHGTTVIGGNLREKTCEADYGDIGGVQTVNCRLAASTLQPEETLKYLMKERPKEDMMFMVKFTYVW